MTIMHYVRMRISYKFTKQVSQFSEDKILYHHYHRYQCEYVNVRSIFID